MRWNHLEVSVAGLEAGVAGICPAAETCAPHFYVVTCDGVLRGIDFDAGTTFFELKLELRFEKPGSATIVASSDGRYVAVVPSRGTTGVLFDRELTQLTPLTREDYHANVSGWAVAFVKHRGVEVLVHATAWNRLEAHALPNFTRVAPTSDESTVDYFWGAMARSPQGTRLSSFGWYWHPVGGVSIIDVTQWLDTGVDPPSGPRNTIAADWWDADICWLDERRIALLGAVTPEDDSYMGSQQALLIVDAETGATLKSLDGVLVPSFGCDGTHLILLGDRTSARSLETFEVLASIDVSSDVWHPNARVALACPPLSGKAEPCRLLWLSGAASTPGLTLLPDTKHINAAALAVLADALEERATHPALVAHCRSPEQHGHRCWAVEALRST